MSTASMVVGSKSMIYISNKFNIFENWFWNHGPREYENMQQHESKSRR